MLYPTFFNEIPTIKLKDKLANFLGVFEEGIYEISYLDIVKSAGHSCPTVLGAYLMTQKALESLYKDEVPIRGEISVMFSQRQNEGVAGVIGSVISNITGAATDNGFKGLNGNFDRNYLMKFECQDISSNVRFSRIDTGNSVDVFYNPNDIKPNEDMNFLMQKCMQGIATFSEQKEFGTLWQQRVENIFRNIDSVIKADIKE
jgi:hypothetical protein